MLKRLQYTYKVNVNKDEINIQKLSNCDLLVFASPQQRFSEQECEALKTFINSGRSVLVLCNEGGEAKNNNNLNYLLEQYGLTVNSDCVVRTSFQKYLHPKENLIQAGILDREVVRVAHNLPREQAKLRPAFLSGILKEKDEDDFSKEKEQAGLDFVYPYGASLQVQDPSQAILSSGPLSYPINRPIACVFKDKGRLAVCGSYQMFTDEYFDKEENGRLFDFFIKFLLSDEAQLDKTYQDQGIQDYTYVPEIAELAESLKSCLEQPSEMPKDFTQLFETNLYKFSTDLIPESVQLYTTLNVKHDILTLIPPQLETPMLGLQPATFPPILRELPVPNLELFDLDEEFAGEKIKLAQLTNKCKNEDLDYYLKEVGDILGISDKVHNRNNAKAIVKYVMDQLISFKMLNQV